MIDGTVFWMAAEIAAIDEHSSGDLRFHFTPVNGKSIDSTLRLSVSITQNQEVVDPKNTMSEKAVMGYCIVGEIYDPTEQIQHTTHTHNLSVLYGYTITNVQDAIGPQLNHDEFHWGRKKQTQAQAPMQMEEEKEKQQLWVHRHDYAITLSCPKKINLIMLIRTVVESTSAFRYGILAHYVE